MWRWPTTAQRGAPWRWSIGKTPSTRAGVDAKCGTVPGFWTTIGETTVKYRAWGDGYQHSRLLERDDGFTVWYEADDTAVGVLTCNADDDYELGGRLIEAGKPAPVPMSR
jgi:3-phenylpropionate/trans-cinnamate dioxygenase ferredoxin reductase subunit